MKKILFCLLFSFSSLCFAGWPEIRHPEGSSVSTVGEEMRFNGTPTQVFVLSLDMDLRKATRYYTQELARRNQRVPVSATQKPDNTVVISQPAGLYFINLTLSASSSERTKGLLSITNNVETRNWQRTPLEFNLPSGSEIIGDLESTDSGRPGRSIDFYNDLTLEQNKQALIRELGRKGYQHEPGNNFKRKGTEVLFFFSQKRDAMVTLRARDGITDGQIILLAQETNK